MNLFAAGWCSGLAFMSAANGNATIAFFCMVLACFNFAWMAFARRI